MSMNLYLQLPRSRQTDDSGIAYLSLPVQINTFFSYSMLYEDYHWVENKYKHHKFLRRSSFRRTLNKYKEYMMKRANSMYPRNEWHSSSYYRQWHNEECCWVLRHIAELAKLGEQGATWDAG